MGHGSGNQTGGPLVCGVDDSEGGRRAARVAASLASKLGLELLLVHVAQARPHAGNGAGPADGVRAERTRGEYLLTAVAVEEDLGPVDYRVELGRPAERLAAVAGEAGAELIVVGSRGHNAVKAALTGSVSTKLIGLAPCPVLIVPPGAAVRGGPEGRT